MGMGDGAFCVDAYSDRLHLCRLADPPKKNRRIVFTPSHSACILHFYMLPLRERSMQSTNKKGKTQMKYSPLGQTGINVSQLTFGGAAVGLQYGNVSQAEVAETLQTAAEAGINLIDTSAYYGEGHSEKTFGELLSPQLRRQFQICTKAGRLAQDRFDFSAKGMRECFEGSLRRLKCDHVDILLAHDIEYEKQPTRIFTETAEVLHQLKKEGKCKAIGMSALPLNLLREVVEQCELDVVISYCHYHLQDQTLLTDLLPLCEAKNVGLMNASPLAMGLLTNQGPPDWHPASDALKTACQEAAKYCREFGQDISELGMRFCLSQPRIATTITGTARREELQRNLAAIDQPPDSQLLAKVLEILGKA